MSKSLELFKIEEKIKISYLKNGGNILEVIKELNLPQDYIKKVIDKLKKKEGRDVSVLISDTIAQHILMGHESRKLHYQQVLKELENSGKVKLSICCSEPAIRIKDSIEYGYEDYECSNCHAKCDAKDATDSEVYRIKKEILEQLREEDRLLMEFAEKMGYTSTVREPTTNVRQNIVIIGDDKDKQVIKQIENLNPKDRDRLLDRLNSEIKEDNEQHTNQNI